MGLKDALQGHYEKAGDTITSNTTSNGVTAADCKVEVETLHFEQWLFFLRSVDTNEHQ